MNLFDKLEVYRGDLVALGCNVDQLEVIDLIIDEVVETHTLACRIINLNAEQQKQQIVTSLDK